MVDTLRSDRLPAYGYEAVATPAIDAFRRDAVLFENAYAHSPLTFPSHSSLFTGLLPADHGVRDNVGYRLSEDHPTLAGVLKGAGYTTGAAVSSYVLRSELGLARGFDFYDDQVDSVERTRHLGSMQRVGRETIDVASRWIGEQRDGPFFFFLHLYDPHTPYAPPPPFDAKYDEPYDNEVAYVDTLVGDFVRTLKNRGIYDDALIIFLSDHGEGLGEHGEDEHGALLYREAIQIPLMMKLPHSTSAGQTVSSAAQIIDLFPTILSQTAATFDLSSYRGMSLLELMRSPPADSRSVYSETYYPRFHFGWSDLHSLTDGRHHFIDAPAPELYDLSNDFGETRNVLEQNRRVMFRMREAIEPLIRDAEAPAPVDPEEAAKFAALGYLGSNVSTDPGEELPDPKDRIGTIREMRSAFAAFQEGNYEETLRRVDALLAENRRMVDLWDLRAKTLDRLGRTREGIAAAKEGLALMPNAHHLLLTVANFSVDTGDYEGAKAHAELALETHPARANEILARIALEQGRLDDAERLLQTALEHRPYNPTSALALARLQDLQGRPDAALATLDRALQIVSEREGDEVASLELFRNHLLARRGTTE